MRRTLPACSSKAAASYLGRIEQALERRRQKGTLRRLPQQQSLAKQQHDVVHASTTDFSSNDYLGLAQSLQQHQLVEARYQQVLQTLQQQPTAILGSTGSRLLTGDSTYCHELEAYLAKVHQREAALVCNSGYDANLAVLQSLPCHHAVVHDEYAHNSIHMGLRLWQSAASQQQQRRRVVSFRHNQVADLRRQLQALHEEQSDPAADDDGGGIMIVVESVYSMDGDVAPLADILDVAAEYGAAVLVDEAHAWGVLGVDDGLGLVQALHLHHHSALFATVYTFGKGAGCHGAALVCNDARIKDYWINFAYPVVYSTALPLHSLVTIRQAYETILTPPSREARWRLQQHVQLFQTLVQSHGIPLLPPDNDSHDPPPRVFLTMNGTPHTPIQALRVAGNDVCTAFCQRLQERCGTVLFPIKSPTVPAGQERVRIVLHAHNTPTQIEQLVHAMQQTLQELQLLPPPSATPVSRL